MKLFAKGEWFGKLSVWKKGNSGNYSVLEALESSSVKMSPSDWVGLFPTCSRAWARCLVHVLRAGCALSTVDILVLGHWLLGFSQPTAVAVPALAISGSLALQTLQSISSCFTLAGVCSATGPSRVPFRGVFGKLELCSTDLEATLPYEVWVSLCQSARFLFCVTPKFQKGST